MKSAYLYNWPCKWQTYTILEENITRSIQTNFGSNKRCSKIVEKKDEMLKEVVKKTDNRRQVMTEAHLGLLF